MNRSILQLIVLEIVTVSCGSHNSKNSELQKKETEPAATESISPNLLPAMYQSVIDEYSTPEYEGMNHTEYFLYDITGDDTPELWISTGSCEADTRLRVYTKDEKKIRLIYDGDGGHSDYFVFNGELVCVMCNTGSGVVITYKYDDRAITDHAVEFSTWNDDGTALSGDSLTNKQLEYWENNYDKYIIMKSID